jgi:LPS sulfotransferase NodH
MSATIVLGVSRSGTTLLKAMLDAHSELAIPTESYFIPQLWDRHGARPDRAAILTDLGRLERVSQWGIDIDEVAQRLPAAPTFVQVIDAVYSAYAESQGKQRYGDKTPLYMQHLDLLPRAFPRAQYVHIVRDGRDAALSFLAMTRRPRFNVSRPRGLADFAAAWRREFLDARAFGRDHPYFELRYEDLVADPETHLREVCAFLGLDYEPAMLDYHRDADLDITVDHVLLTRPPVRTARKWREQMASKDVELFEAIAGDVLSALGYERAYPDPGRRARAAAERALYAARLAAWRVALPLVRKSPAWRLRQVYIRRST